MEKKHSKEQIRLTVSADYLMQDYKKEEKDSHKMWIFFLYVGEKRGKNPKDKMGKRFQ